MTTLREAAEMALEALEYYRSGEDYYPTPASDAIICLREALEADSKREWQELTNEEIEWIKGSANRAIGYIRVTAAKLKEKNT